MPWDDLLEGSQGQVPEHLLIAFVNKRFGRVHPRESLRFLDIGPGRHAPNQNFLETKDYNVLSVDVAARAKKNLFADIGDVEFPAGHFDLIYDINTLCHVENPPMEKIVSWLKLGGHFFSIAPASDTWRGVGEGKEFTRYATEEEAEAMLDGHFSGWYLRPREYPSGDNQIRSWVMWGKK